MFGGGDRQLSARIGKAGWGLFGVLVPKVSDRELTGLVAGEPEKYAGRMFGVSCDFSEADLRAVYSGQGFQDAVKAERRFAWRPVLDLCVWARQAKIDKSRGRVRRFEMDAQLGWDEGRRFKAFDRKVFPPKRNPIPLELREAGSGLGSWRELLIPKPTPEQEREYVEKGRQRGKSNRGEGLTSATAI